MINLGSTWRGIRAMQPHFTVTHLGGLQIDGDLAYRRYLDPSLRVEAKWSVKWLPRRFWCDAWTPVWHAGRGPYVTLGLWLFAIYRGY